uniref:Uncharacterized protein n=1 Tax=Tanacetum cinerariifolium TaxID=118510 RepID=A0A6L2LC18_TANCI|nr:hypothetical protein [Tanacetum cinerariifolium]
MEYLVKISKKARILELKRRHLKITFLTSNTAYPSRKIRRICACTSQKTMKETRSIRRLREKYRLNLKNDMLSQDKKLLKTLSLDESRSPEFNLFSDLKEYFKEGVMKTMAETMEQYMSKTRADYGSGIARLEIDDKDSFELKGQFLKELRDNTFSGSDHEDVNEHIEKVLEIVNLFHIPNITQDQASRWIRNKPSGSITTWEDLKTKQILNSKGAIPFKTTADANVAIQEMAEYSQKWHNGTSRTRSTETSDGLAAIQAQLNNLEREIKKVNEKVYAAQVGCELCKRPHYTKYCPLKEGGASVSVMPLSTYLNLGLGELAHTKLTFELVDRTVKYLKGIAKNMLVVVENMDGYRDQDMGDIILREPFYKASCVEAERFDVLINIHNGSDNVTYQMAQSHPRFKHLSNAQCNKIKPLLKVSLHDKLNRISHPYQKLKSFYKEVLNLGLEYVRDAKMEEWLTRSRCKEFDKVGEVLIIWNPMCDCSHACKGYHFHHIHDHRKSKKEYEMKMMKNFRERK